MISGMSEFAEAPTVKPYLIVARHGTYVDGDFERDAKKI